MSHGKAGLQVHPQNLAAGSGRDGRLLSTRRRRQVQVLAVMENLQEHLKYQLELEANGSMFAAGPFADDEEQEWEGEGMVILRAESLAEARSMAENDPMHKSGARTFRLRPWMLNEGSITINVTYSNGKRNIT